MSVRLITGKSGSGKTLFMLYQLTKRFFYYDKESQIFKPNKDNILVITNIDGFSQDIPHLVLQREIEYINFRKMCIELKSLSASGRCPSSLIGYTVDKLNSLIDEYEFTGIDRLPSLLRDYYIETRKENEAEYFFRNKVQKPYLEGMHAGKVVIYVLDEAQKYFPVAFKDRDVCYFFEYHRHYGCEIFMATQHRNFLSRALRDNIEVEYSAARKSLTSGKIYVYSVMYDNVKAGVDILRSPSKYYPLYKSAFIHSEVKEKNLLVRTLAVCSILLFLGIAGFSWRFFFSGRSSLTTAQRLAADKQSLNPSSVSLQPGSRTFQAGSGSSNPVRQPSPLPAPSPVNTAPQLEWREVSYYCLDDICYFLSDIGGFVPIPASHKRFGSRIYLNLPKKSSENSGPSRDTVSASSNRIVVGGTDS